MSEATKEEAKGHCIGESQCQPVGAPAPKTWDDYEAGCEATYGGGYRTNEEIEIFHHGMATIFNLLRGEFPSASKCKAVDDLIAACKAALRLPDLSVYAEEASGSHHHSARKAKEYHDKMNAVLEQIEAAIAKATTPKGT